MALLVCMSGCASICRPLIVCLYMKHRLAGPTVRIPGLSSLEEFAERDPAASRGRVVSMTRPQYALQPVRGDDHASGMLLRRAIRLRASKGMLTTSMLSLPLLDPCSDSLRLFPTHDAYASLEEQDRALASSSSQHPSKRLRTSPSSNAPGLSARPLSTGAYMVADVVEPADQPIQAQVSRSQAASLPAVDACVERSSRPSIAETSVGSGVSSGSPSLSFVDQLLNISAAMCTASLVSLDLQPHISLSGLHLHKYPLKTSQLESVVEDVLPEDVVSLKP